MATIYKSEQCPIFKEVGDIKLTTPYGADIPDYPTKGKKGDHWGCDIVRSTDGKNSTTATITAIADGVITAQRKWVKEDTQNPPSAGNCVYIRHEDGTVTKYMHLKHGTMPDYIKDNAVVKKGDTLGYMGNTGYSYNAHLHFQVEVNGKTVDPLPYLLGEKVIGKTYGVRLTKEFSSEEQAEKIASALNDLGIEAVVE